MAIDNTNSTLKRQIEQEVQQYFTEVVQLGDGITHSESRLKKRIALFEAKVYPKGKFDSQMNYKFWFDAITPRIDTEVKNIDFDTKDIIPFSEGKYDDVPNRIVRLKLSDYCKTTGQAEEINSAIEEGAGWGNIVWKKVKKTYERVDLRNFYVINQTAFSLNDTPAIERHQLNSSDLRTKVKVWENVKEVLEECKTDTYQSEAASQENVTTVPYFDIYERHGEVSLKDLKETNGEKSEEGDEDKYVFARVIGAGKKGANESGVSIEYILFAQELKGKKMSDIFKEYHRGRYKGKWWREGLYELLFDVQVRLNQIGNQIALGLEYASKKVLYTPDKLLIQNIMSDLQNGDVLRASQLSSVDFRMEGFDQLVADYNRLVGLANDIANSREVVQGDSLPSGTTLGAYNMLNANANKLFVLLREKIGIPFSAMFEQWIIPGLVEDLKAEEVIRLSGDSELMDRMKKDIVDDWYVNNLIAIGPHDQMMAETLKNNKLDEMNKRPEILMKGMKQLFDGYKARVMVNITGILELIENDYITGESLNLDADLQTILGFVALEADPVRRSALIEMGMKKKSIDVSSLPKSPPQPTMSPVPMPQQVVAK